jgi:hypothetical protein
MARPEMTQTISLGNVLTIGALLASIGGGWVVMQERSEANQLAIQQLESGQRARFAELELRVRALENQAARSDERFAAIMQTLARIERKIEGEG